MKTNARRVQETPNSPTAIMKAPTVNGKQQKMRSTVGNLGNMIQDKDVNGEKKPLRD